MYTDKYAIDPISGRKNTQGEEVTLGNQIKHVFSKTPGTKDREMLGMPLAARQ